MPWISTKGDSIGVGWRDTQGRERWKKCHSGATAQALKTQIAARLLQGEDWEPDRPRQATPLRDILRQFILTLFEELQPRTVTRYANDLDLFTKFVEMTRHSEPTAYDLSRPLLEDFVAWLGRTENARHGRARKRITVLKTVQTVERAWRWAEQSDRWTDIPRPRSLNLRRPRPPRRAAATFEEWDRMLSAFAQHVSKSDHSEVARDWVMRVALLARYTGARRLALLQLQWSDVDLDGHRMDFRDETTKGGYSGRMIPLHPALVREMRRWKHLGSTLVAAPLAELNGRGHVDRCLRRAWQRAGVREQVWKGQPVHVARRTLRTHMVTRGVQADIIDAFIGHVGAGTGGRVYTDRDALWLWEPLVAAVATVPEHKLATP